ATGRRAPRERAAIRSQRYLHAVIGDFPACGVGKVAFRRVVEQGRVRVVDMDEDRAPDAEITKDCNRAVIAAHAHMPHAAACLAADPEPDHFVVAPQGPVKKYERATGEARTESVGHRRAAGDEKEPFFRRGLDDLQAYGIAFLAQP